MIAALVRHRTHRIYLPLILVTGGIMLDLVICLQASAIGESRLADDRPTHLPPHLREQIRFKKDSFLQQNEQTASNGGIIYHFIRGTDIEGIKPPYYCRIVGAQTTATLRSGKIIHSVVEQAAITPAQDIRDIMGVPFEAAVIGVSPAIPGATYANPGTVLRAFTYLPSRLPAGEDLSGVTIKGEAQLEIHRAYLAGSIPVTPGAVFSQPRQRYEITEVSGWQSNPAPGGIFIKVSCLRLPLILRGDAGDGSERLSWALVCQPKNQMLDGYSGSYFGSTFPVDIAGSSMLYSRPGNPPLSSDWIKGAKLVFLGNETCGQITVPYEMDNVTLTR